MSSPLDHPRIRALLGQHLIGRLSGPTPERPCIGDLARKRRNGAAP